MPIIYTIKKELGLYRRVPGYQFPLKKICLEYLLHLKIRLWISEGGLWSYLYFWAIVLISAVIKILDDVGSLLPARTVTVKCP